MKLFHAERSRQPVAKFSMAVEIFRSRLALKFAPEKWALQFSPVNCCNVCHRACYAGHPHLDCSRTWSCAKKIDHTLYWPANGTTAFIFRCGGPLSSLRC